MKKIFILFVLTLVPMLASADAVEIDGIYYNLISKGKIAEVTSNPNQYSGEVIIPASVTYEDVEYSVTSIGNLAFYGCSGLTSITIPNSVTSIGATAFTYCSGLTSVHISDIAAWCNISFGFNYPFGSNPLYYAHHLYLNGNEVKDLVIPNSVTSIGDYAFYGCSGLISITVPNSVTSIGGFAFSDCTGMTSITIPNSVTSIGNGAFSGCTGLISITIPNSVTSIGQSAFYECSGLTSITIPNSVTSIGTCAFIRCTGLTSITIPNSVTSIGQEAFYGCSGLTSITIPNSVTSIGNYAFKNCTGLTSITIGNSVTGIWPEAFRGCSSLTSITIGSGVKTIYENVFAYCPNLADVYCYAMNVPSTNTTSFDKSYPEYATLHVPDKSLQAYKETEPWSLFGTIVGLSGGTPETPKCATPTISYDDDNKKLTFGCETEGVEYVYSIKDTDIKQGYDAEVSLTATYEISVYATKAGYENSDVATATLVWGSATFTDTTPATAIEMVPAMEAATPVLIQNNGGTLTIQGAQDGTPISVYTVAGMQAGTAVSQNSRATISTSMQQGDIAIIKIGERSVKVVIK